MNTIFHFTFNTKPYFFVGRIDRYRKLQEQWYFNCSCSRCLDPSEFGTWTSSITCQYRCRDVTNATFELLHPILTTQNPRSGQDLDFKDVEACLKTEDSVKYVGKCGHW